jgi:hypothetical protein
MEDKPDRRGAVTCISVLADVFNDGVGDVLENTVHPIEWDGCRN